MVTEKKYFMEMETIDPENHRKLEILNQIRGILKWKFDL